MRIVSCILLLSALPLSAQKPMDQYQGFNGFWLKNDRAEAFAIAEPYPRILAFRLKGGENPLHVSREYEYIGIRSWFFEPTQIRESGMPALRPATAETTGERSLRLTAAPDDSSGLQLTMEIEIDAERPILKIRHGFKNLRNQQRRIACWALNVIRPDAGVGVTPWRREGRRSLLFWPDTDPNEIGIHSGPRALALDYRIEPQNRDQYQCRLDRLRLGRKCDQIHCRPRQQRRIPRRWRHRDNVQLDDRSIRWQAALWRNRKYRSLERANAWKFTVDGTGTRTVQRN